MNYPIRFSHTIIRSYFILLICPFLFSAKPVPEKTMGNKKFSSADYKVAIIFPGEYTEQEDKETGKSTLKVSCNLKNELFYLGVTKHSVIMENHEKMAEVSLNAFAKALNGEIRNQHIYSQNKKNGLDALIWLPDEKSFVHYRAILAGQLQYQVMVLEPGSDISKKGKTFMSSFKMLK